VTPPASPMLSQTNTAVCVLCILLVPFAIAGLALINTGLGRSRSAAHSMMASLCAVAVAVIVYFFCGFAWQGFTGGPAHVLTIDGKPWNWLAAQPFFLRGLALNGSSLSLAAWLGMFSVALAAVIPLGSGADRWRLGAICASTALLAGWTYPLFAHWVWGGGWLAQLGANYGLGHGFVDSGGAGGIHVLGGFTALSIAFILGPRRGKFAPDGMTAAIPGHNAVYILFGCLLALIGWLGLNSAGALLFAGSDPGRVVLICMNTTLAAATAALSAAVTTRARFGKPDASLSVNGWVSGLVAGSAACAFVSPAAAVVIGLVAGVLVTFSVEWLELKLAVDDPGGAISVHGVCGIWGLLAVALFAHLPAQVVGLAASRLPGSSGGNAGQWTAQLIGVATLIGFVLPLTYGLNWLLNRILPQRVAPEGERQGMDLHELGAGAYPEFITHDEFT
jgi:Amt family ammonium transporter